MLNEELRAKLRNRDNNINTGGGDTIGLLPYSNYRKIKSIWHKIPTHKEYEAYKLFCYIRGFDAECMQSIVANSKK